MTEAGNVWYAWSFATGGNGSWVPGTATDGAIAFEVAEVKDQIIFVRMDGNNGNVPSWDAKLNQTSDLAVQAGGTYVISGLGETNMTGFWRVESSNGKPIWQQSNPADAATYLANRRALVGRHCMVNKLINAVGVGSWIKDLNNLVDEDLENYATFPKIADVGVGVNPVTSVRDTKNHYAAGTTAGFNVVMAADASLLGLDLANCFAISFYLEGELQQTVAVSNGQSFGGVGLSLITLPGSDNVSIDIAAEAPCEFDEISLMPAGVNVEVASSAKIRYAFVGDLTQHTITQTSMQNYAASHGRLSFSLDQGAIQRDPDGTLDISHPVLTETGYWVGSDLINDDLTDGVVWGVISIGSSMEARVGAAINRADPDQSQPFKKGSTVGFSYGNGSLLNLPLGDAIRIRLYRGHWEERHKINGDTYYEYVQEEVQDESVKINVLSLNLIKGGNYEVSITANEDFSHARISFPTGLTLNVGGTKVKYAYVCDPPESYHHCDLALSANAAVCSSESQYQLTHNPEISVSWSLVDEPGCSTNGSVSADGLLTMNDEGSYKVRATAADGCYDDIIVTRGLDATTATCDDPMINADGESTYVLSGLLNDGGALVSINGQLEDRENVLSPSLQDFATLQSGINATVVENLPIVGVKKSGGNISTGTSARRIGFLVEIQSNGLGLDAIDLFNIRTYKDGVQTSSQVVSENNAVKLKLIGNTKMQKMRLAVVVPENVEFDEFVLWKSGVLDVSLDPKITRMRVYYAFDDDVVDETVNECIDPMGCDASLLSGTTGATLNHNELQFAGAINVANVLNNLSYLVDNDINSGVSITNSVSLGTGVVLAFDLGRVYGAGHQLGMVVDGKTYLARVKAGNWLTMKTYLNGEEQESHSDWSVLGVNAIGYGDKSYIFMNPTLPFDEVRITIAAIADALSFDQKYYDIFVREDYDMDGIPNCHDDDSCVDEFTLDEEATVLEKGRSIVNGNLALHRSFTLHKWNDIVLPVDLTWGQLRSAFGREVKLATPRDYYVEPNVSNLNIVTYTEFDSDIADNVVAIEAGKYYLLNPTREPDMPRQIDGTVQTYTAIENKQPVTINGPVYFINGVSYSQEWDNKVPDVASITFRVNNGGGSQAPRLAGESESVVLHGTTVHLDGTANALVPASSDGHNNYVYDPTASNLQSLVKLTEPQELLGFRFYAENQTSKDLTHGVDVITGIDAVSASGPVVRRGIYSIDGRKLSNGNDTRGLSPGIYIVDGQKMIIQ
ncbi:MAG: hypothetical protein IJ613_02725 [Muribaculaceae bacterium]|nr:hypothetical protein [Muribaculaceae bacterium]